MRPRVAVIGSANVDFIFQIDRLPAVGETVIGGEFRQTYGGKGANQAVAAARLGGQTTFVAAVGDDAYGRQIADNCRDNGINAAHINVIPDRPTGAAGVLFDSGGNNYLAVASGANHALTPAHIDAAAAVIKEAGIVLLQMEVLPETNRRAIMLASRHNVRVLLNYAPAQSLEIEVDDRIWGLVVNETEAAQVSGLPCRTIEEARNTASHLMQRVQDFVVVTLGRDGAIAADCCDIVHIPPLSVKAVDATAAGDVFCGCLAVELGRGKSLVAACARANAAAALSVTRPGALPSIPTAVELDSFLQDHTL